MSLEEKSFIETDDQYGSGLCLNKYKGEISICSAHKGDDGKIYLDWIYPQTKDRKPSEKTLPWKIGLGKAKQAAKYLRYLAEMLDNIITTPLPVEKGSSNPVVQKNDVPF